MQPRLVRVRDSAEAFAPLVEAANAAGLRVGWLQLAESVEIPPDLEVAVAAGALRAVAVGERRTLAAKMLAGPAVLRDIVREQFTGCRLLLVRGDVDAPEVFREADGWRVRWPTDVESVLSTEEFVSRLRKPSFP